MRAKEKKEKIIMILEDRYGLSCRIKIDKLRICIYGIWSCKAHAFIWDNQTKFIGKKAYDCTNCYYRSIIGYNQYDAIEHKGYSFFPLDSSAKKFITN